MQKLVYVSNSRDFTESNDINENKYFTYVNELLGNGWKIGQVMRSTGSLDQGWNHAPPVEKTVATTVEDGEFSRTYEWNIKPEHRETFAAFVVLEKPDGEN